MPKEQRECDRLMATHGSYEGVIFTGGASIQLRNDASSNRPQGLQFWGGISKRGSTELLVFQGILDNDFYVGEFINNTVLKFTNNKFTSRDHLFIYYDSIYASQRDMQEKICKMPRSAVTWATTPDNPERNPMTSFWHEMKQHIKEVDKPKDLLELSAKLTKYWNDHTNVKQCGAIIDTFRDSLSKHKK